MAAVMLQGTGSDVGKSVLVAGLCRALSNGGLAVRPFKPQNMSNNAAVTADGGEIGRAQALQAIAARVPPSTDMNPVLLKPQSDRTAQVIVNGRVRGVWRAAGWRHDRAALLDDVLSAYRHLRDEADIVVVEGAGSPAEINLREGDIANMGFARAADVPVVLIGDIDRGGVIASLVGTKAVLDEADAAMIRGFVVNKFRGDPRLFDDGMAAIEHRTGWPALGLVPWLADASRLPAEDAVALGQGDVTAGEELLIAVPMLSRIANFDDLDALVHEPRVRLAMIPPGQPLPGDAALVILPGTKATIADLGFLREQGWDIDLQAHLRRGGRVLGLCGGYQMLGRTIADPEGIEGSAMTVSGLELLAVDTVIRAEKRVTELTGYLAGGAAFCGYEIHCGVTRADPGVAPMLHRADGSPDGAVALDGRVAGCYVHGLFDRPDARAALLSPLGIRSDGMDRHDQIDAALDGVAAALEQALDLNRLIAIAKESQ